MSVPEVPNASAYSWTVPPDVQIVSGVGTNSIIVDWSGATMGGLVCVNALNDCGSSPWDCVEITLDTISSWNEITQKEYIVYPNPTKDKIYILFDNNSSYEVTCIDLLGREVISPTLYKKQAEIKVSNLPSGTYWLKLNKGNQVFWEIIEVILD